MQEEEQSLSAIEDTHHGFSSTSRTPPPYGAPPAPARTRHIYLEEENIYGRFIPYLLLKDQLESEMDSSGSTALHHMCSHNSPYLPLYLSTLPKGAPILNRRSKMGHLPIDVAGLYCSLEYVNLMREKGAVDDGNVDHWAIQGANLANWSGTVDPKKPFLIHWAAYNDLADVLLEYNKIGCSLSEPDTNGYTAMDLAVLNKSYNSIRVLGELGYKPRKELLESSDSKSIKQYFRSLNKTKDYNKAITYLKFMTCPLFLLISLILSASLVTITLSAITLLLCIYLGCIRAPPEPYMNDNRTTTFTSQLLLNNTINKNNLIPYLFLHASFVLAVTSAIFTTYIETHWKALLVLILAMAGLAYLTHLVVLVYGVRRNLTYSEMFESHKWPHLWSNIRYVPERKMVIREFSNPYDRGAMANISALFED